MTATSASTSTKQQVGLVGAVAIGIASMLGAGVFVVFHTAFTNNFGDFYLALGLAALVATLNAWGVYSLARQIERPGGIYAYSRVYVNKTVSFSAGFAFVFGKIGSIAAIALAFNSYFLSEHRFWPAAVAIAMLTVINILGIQRTTAVATVLAVTTSAYFLYLAVMGLVAPAPKEIFIPAVAVVTPVSASPFPVVSAAAIFFFAFAGYARVATLGNEVRDAKRNIPRAIAVALIAVVGIYFVLAFVLQKFLSYNLMLDRAPFKTLAEQFIPVWPHQVTILVATLASLGSMLALLAGVSRTAATMAEDNELLPIFKKRNRFGSPWFSEVLIALGAIALVAIGDLSWVIGFSSFSVLFYYAVGHISVLRQPKQWRVMPPIMAWLGLLLCTVLAFAVPGPAAPVSFLILILALAGRFVHQRNQLMALSKLN